MTAVSSQELILPGGTKWTPAIQWIEVRTLHRRHQLARIRRRLPLLEATESGRVGTNDWT